MLNKTMQFVISNQFQNNWIAKLSGQHFSCVENLVFGVYKNSLRLREVHMID